MFITCLACRDMDICAILARGRSRCEDLGCVVVWKNPLSYLANRNHICPSNVPHQLDGALCCVIGSATLHPQTSFDSALPADILEIETQKPANDKDDSTLPRLKH